MPRSVSRGVRRGIICSLWLRQSPVSLNGFPLKFGSKTLTKVRITQKYSRKQTKIAMNQSETAIKCPDVPEKINLPNLGFNKFMHLLKAIKATIIQSA